MVFLALSLVAFSRRRVVSSTVSFAVFAVLAVGRRFGCAAAICVEIDRFAVLVARVDWWSTSLALDWGH
jgi:hypothetical protein